MSHVSIVSPDHGQTRQTASTADAGLDAAPLSLRRISGSDYRMLASEAADLDLRCLYQEPDWLEAYLGAIAPARPLAPEYFAVYARNRLAGLLPLAQETGKGGVRTLTFLGWNRANQNTGLWNSRLLDGLDGGILMAALRGLAREAGADLIHLPNLPAETGGRPNPLLCGRSIQSPSPVFKGPLEAAFETLLRQGHGKDGRKKLLRKKRALEEAGNYLVVEASTPDEIERGLQAFLHQRDLRCRETGIPNAFSETPDQNFLRTLLTPGDGTPAPLCLFWLETAGAIRATYICSRRGKCLTGYANSIAQDEMMPFSPGVVLLMDIMEKACSDPQITTVDLGLGDERYKHPWTAPEPLFDALEALTLKGRTVLALTGLKQMLKSRIRASKTLWPLVRRVRKLKAGLRQAA